MSTPKTKPWHEEAREWVESVSPDPAEAGVLHGWLHAALAEREELLGLLGEAHATAWTERDVAAATERAAVVAWLRAQCEGGGKCYLCFGGHLDHPYELATAIEQGKHRE